MPRLTRTERAEQDLIDIWCAIAAENEKAADTVLNNIDAACQNLATFPKLGPARPDLAPNLRYTISGRYLILYRIIPTGIEIIRVIHGARHLPSLIAPDQTAP